MGIRWKTDFDKHVIISNFQRRGWEQVTDEDDMDWDIFWASVGSAKQVFGMDSGMRLQPGQLINHFQNHYELTRKDLLVKNIKRFQRQQKKEGQTADDLDIIPTTYVLPQEYALFVEEFRRLPSATWIMKPSAKSQGKGIFLIHKLSQVKDWSKGTLPPALRNGAESYIVSRYIDQPLLIGGKKFDMRLYVVVTSFKPLKVYLSRHGFGRFCNAKYTTEPAELDNEFIHLTNVAIQKCGQDYNERHGNKWVLDNILLYLEGTQGVQKTEQLLRDIEAVIVNSLKACQNIIINDKHCFELYGYDVIIDQALKPWLIEVNASPSLSTTTQADRLLKYKVISDVLDIVTPPEWLDDAPHGHARGITGMKSNNRTRTSDQDIGSFRLIYDESRNNTT